MCVCYIYSHLIVIEWDIQCATVKKKESVM